MSAAADLSMATARQIVSEMIELKVAVDVRKEYVVYNILGQV